MRLTGLRGVGKTVLLREFERVAEGAAWASAFLELRPSHNADDAIAKGLTDTLAQSRGKLSRKERLRQAVGGSARQAGTLGLAWGDFAVTYQPGDVGREDLKGALFGTVEMAVEKGYSGFVLLLDEAQVIRDEQNRLGAHPLSLLISSMVALQQAELPLGLVLCGLPTLIGNVLKARSYTERMFRGEEIDSLKPDEARNAFVQPPQEVNATVQIDEDLVVEIIDEVEGYPYFIQLWGAELWDAATDAGTSRLSRKLLDATRPEIYHRLDLDFYEPRVATLTPAEQDVLLATADCGYPPLVVANLNDVIDKTPGNVNVLLGRLVESGVLYRIRKGQYEYTAPKFRDYLLRRTGGTSRAGQPELF